MSTSVRKLAIVTGTTSGLGSVVAAQLLERGWDVIGIARRTSPLSHGRYRHCQIDLGDLSALVSTLERDVAPLLDGGVSRVALVNNAARADLLAPIEAIDALELASLYSLNVVAPVWCMGFVSRHAPTAAALRIVNVSTGAAVRAFPGLGAYGSTKAALRMAGMVLAAEWESTVLHAPTRTNAGIFSYEPAAVDTPMQEMARSIPPTIFPWVGMFTAMHDRGVLVPPEGPAGEIVEFVEAADVPSFSERRYGQ